MQKDSQTATKLEQKLFYRFQYVHSNAILISKLHHHLPTCGNLGIGATSLIPWGLSYSENTFLAICQF